NSSIVFNHHRFHFCWDHRRFDVGPGETSNSVQRCPPCHYEKFDSTLDRPAEYRGVDEPRNLLEGREGLPLEVFLVRGCMTRPSQTSPVSGNHNILKRAMDHVAITAAMHVGEAASSRGRGTGGRPSG